MSIKKPNLLKGFRDLLPKEALTKSDLIYKLKNQFELFGFTPIETPHLEYTELLIKESEGEISKQLYRFNDNGDRDVCLRFDLTVPLARFVAKNQNDLIFPFKRYAIGNVFRAEKPQFGRYREFTQCDIDFIGTESRLAEAEILKLIISSLKSLNVKDFTIRVNNRKIMNSIGIKYNFVKIIGDVLRVVDKIDKIGRAEVINELHVLGLKEEQILAISSFLDIGRGEPKEILEKLRALKIESQEFTEAINELDELQSFLGETKNIEYDVTIARGLGYYTGIVYETNLLELPEIGSVCSGGRYDNLTQNFSKQKMSGVGASFGLDRLITALLELKQINQRETKANILCAQIDKASVSYILKLAEELREKGVAVESYPDLSKLKKQFQYAEKKNIQFMVIAGSEEIEKGVFTFKNLKNKEQFEFKNASQIIEYISNLNE